MTDIQNLIVHDVIGRRKTLLDQFSKGLDALGFRSSMKQNSFLFEELFVAKNILTTEKVKESLKFPKALNE